jgi:hypothetical protein
LELAPEGGVLMAALKLGVPQANAIAGPNIFRTAVMRKKLLVEITSLGPLAPSFAFTRLHAEQLVVGRGGGAERRKKNGQPKAANGPGQPAYCSDFAVQGFPPQTRTASRE